MKTNSQTKIILVAATMTLGLLAGFSEANASSCYKMSQGVCKQSSFGTLDSTCQYDCKVALKQQHKKKPTAQVVISHKKKVCSTKTRQC
jgi:hypothetical protein